MTLSIPGHLYADVMRLVNENGYSVEDAIAKAAAQHARSAKTGPTRDESAKDGETPVTPGPRRPGGSKRTKAMDALEDYLFLGGWGRVETEHRFHAVRRWRADYYLPDQDPPVLVEYDGLMNNKAHGSNVGHASISGILRDSEKLNAATAMGIRCFRANAKSIHDGSFFEIMDTVLKKTVTPDREDDSE